MNIDAYWCMFKHQKNFLPKKNTYKQASLWKVLWGYILYMNFMKKIVGAIHDCSKRNLFCVSQRSKENSERKPRK